MLQVGFDNSLVVYPFDIIGSTTIYIDLIDCQCLLLDLKQYFIEENVFTTALHSTAQCTYSINIVVPCLPVGIYLSQF